MSETFTEDELQLSARALHSWTLDATAHQTPEARTTIQLMIGDFSYRAFALAMRSGVLYPQPFLDDMGELVVGLQVMTDNGLETFGVIGIDWCGPALESIFRRHFENDSKEFARDFFGSDHE